MPQMTEALVKELIYFGKNGPSDFFESTPIKTIYFGGGTPSVLPVEALSQIIEIIQSNYVVTTNPEITLEANPDDLSLDYCKQLKAIGINRLSIGIQSFYEEHLKWMNRSHSAEQAKSCVPFALSVGIKNISVDLIYGFPGLSDDQWLSNLELVNSMGVNHLSCYSLTVEDRTPLKKLIDTKRYEAPSEDASVKHFNMLMDFAGLNLWEHYEISNFCKNQHYSKHNTAYWQQKKYLGIGPSAHSYNGVERRWNIRDNAAYIESWENNTLDFEKEVLSEKERFNDLILISLRTTWGLNTKVASDILGQDFLETRKLIVDKFVDLGLIQLEGINLKLTMAGKHYADGIASEFFE